MRDTDTVIPNWINGEPRLADGSLDKFNPHTGSLLYRVAHSSVADVNAAVSAAAAAFPVWSGFTPIERGRLLFELVSLMKRNRTALAECIAEETGKPPRDADGEVAGAIQQGEFFASEGMRLYGRSLTSGVAGKMSFTVRQPHGVVGLIVPANTPIANIAWKVFPALICGNCVVLKAAEDAPRIASLFAGLVREAGLPDGTVNVIQGSGAVAGAAVVDHPDVKLISFTGSTAAGRVIASRAGQRLARVSLELGGKNALVIAEDADLERALHWATLSAFSNAGQRCAAASRILVARPIYAQFRDRIVARAASLRLGIADGCDLGPVVNRRQQQSILQAVARGVAQGGTLLCGGTVPHDPDLAGGFYVLPTIVEGIGPDAELCQEELFGPVTTLLPFDGLEEAIAVANATQFGLTSAIHTTDIDKALWFARHVRTGVVNINLGTYGSEPHMPFGGFGASGNGTREPGVEALDVYSELKNVSMLSRPVGD